MTNNDLRLTKENNFYGLWWIPNEKNKVFGILKYSPKKMILELHEGFNLEKYYAPIIFGLVKGVKFTLQNAYEISSGNGISKPAEVYDVTYAYVGKHMNIKSFKFKKFFLNLSLSKYFINLTGFKLNLDPKDIMIGKFKLNYNAVPTKKYKINDDIKLTLIVVYKMIREIYNHPIIDEDYVIIVECNDGMNTNDLFEFIDSIRGFFSLGLCHVVQPLKIEFDLLEEESTLLKEGMIFTTIFNNEQKITNPDIRNIIYTYRSIEPNFELYLKNWFGKKSKIAIMYKLYSTILYTKGGYFDNDFLSLIRGIESYYRSFEEHKKKKLSEMLSLIMVKYSFLFENIDQSKFIKSVVDERNYLVHYDKKKYDNLNSQSLYNIQHILMLIIESLLLTEIGFTQDKIKIIMLKKIKWYEPSNWSF